MYDQYELDEKDLECIARLLQSTIFAEDLLFGCKYCRFSQECHCSNTIKNKMHIDVIREKLERITGLDFGYHYDPGNPDAKFVYK